MRLLFISLEDKDMDCWKSSVGRSPGQFHGRGAAGAPGDIRRQPHRDVSNLCEDSTRSRDISGIGAFSKRNCQKIDFD